MKISGYVRAEYSWNSSGLKSAHFAGPADVAPSTRADTSSILHVGTNRAGHTGTLTGGSVSLDARMPTGAGTARGYLRLRSDQFNGAMSASDAR